MMRFQSQAELGWTPEFRLSPESESYWGVLTSSIGRCARVRFGACVLVQLTGCRCLMLWPCVLWSLRVGAAMLA